MVLQNVLSCYHNKGPNSHVPEDIGYCYYAKRKAVIPVALYSSVKFRVQLILAANKVAETLPRYSL